jgi:beta-barrel assembly-enhancing protease
MSRLILLLLSFMMTAPSWAIDLPEMGNSASTIVSAAEEQEIGKAFMRELRRQVEVIDDIEINNYINMLGHKLVSYSDGAEQPFYFFVVKDKTINAFAVPGGFIGFHSELILTAQSESELASVCAHEIAHVTQHHIARTIEASSQMSIPMIAGMIAAAVLAFANPTAGQAAIAALTAGNIQMQINFTRNHESEADRVGIKILADSGFDPRDMANFFQRLQAENRHYTQSPEFLRSHPITTDRIAEARERAERYPAVKSQDSPSYHLMRAKLLVTVTEDIESLIKQLQTMLAEKNFRDERATRYALALAVLKTKKTENVQEQIDWLVKHDSDRVAYRLLGTRLALLQKDVDKAIQLFDAAMKIYPTDQQLSLQYAEDLLQLGRVERAKQILLKTAAHAYPNYYQLLAQAHQKTDSPAEAALAQAEFYYLNGQTGLAVEQLRQARNNKKLSFYLASRIEARFRTLQQELQQEKAKQDERE